MIYIMGIWIELGYVIAPSIIGVLIIAPLGKEDTH